MGWLSLKESRNVHTWVSFLMKFRRSPCFMYGSTTNGDPSLGKQIPSSDRTLGWVKSFIMIPSFRNWATSSKSVIPEKSSNKIKSKYQHFVSTFAWNFQDAYKTFPCHSLHSKFNILCSSIVFKSWIMISFKFLFSTLLFRKEELWSAYRTRHPTCHSQMKW